MLKAYLVSVCVFVVLLSAFAATPLTAVGAEGGWWPSANYQNRYQIPFVAEGGVPPYTWSVVGQPGGLTIDAATGKLSGRPLDKEGVFTVSATVQDSAGAKSSVTGKMQLCGFRRQDGGTKKSCGGFGN